MFEALKKKAGTFANKVILKATGTDAFQEDEDFTKRIEQFKATRESIKELFEVGKKMIEAQVAAHQATAAYVSFCLFSPFAAPSPSLHHPAPIAPVLADPAASICRKARRSRCSR
jgi:hypothetical protein